MDKEKKQTANVFSLSQKDTQQTNVQRVVRAEVNLLVLPCFTLYKHRDPLESIRFSSITQRNGQQYEMKWIVTPNAEFGIPTDFDRRILRACEFFWSKLPRPLSSPLLVPSARELARLMKVKYTGKFVQRLKLALRRLQGIVLTSHMAAYDKKKKSWIDDAFHIFDRVVLAGKKDDDGNVAKRTIVYPSEIYLDNLDSRYVCPLDYDYLMSLSPAASRMYELLSVKFYGSPDEYVEYLYPSLCGLLPAEQQTYLSLARQQLNPPQKELKDTGFLGDYDWLVAPEAKGNWYIRYMAGERYKQYQKLFSEKLSVDLALSPEENQPVSTELSDDSPDAYKDPDPLASGFIEIVSQYSEFDVDPEQDAEWFTDRLTENPDYESLDLEDEVSRWADWLETEHRKKRKRRTNKFPKSNFKGSLTNWLKKAKAFHEREENYGGVRDENNRRYPNSTQKFDRDKYDASTWNLPPELLA